MSKFVALTSVANGNKIHLRHEAIFGVVPLLNGNGSRAGTSIMLSSGAAVDVKEFTEEILARIRECE